MPKAREFSIRIENQPGTLAKVAQTLANRGVNILAFQSIPFEGKSLVRFVVDDPTAAKSVLDTQNLDFTGAEVAQIKLPHRSGELARAASQLGEANININYAYSGVDPVTNTPLLIFGVADIGRAVTILDKTAATGAGA
jgi:hypothetical protein